MGTLLERLATHMRSGPDAERPLAGRVGGALWLFGAGAALLLPLFPQTGTSNLRLLVALTAAGICWGALAAFVIEWRRAPAWVMPLANFAGVAFVAVVSEITGGDHSPARLYSVLTLVFGVCFLDAWEAAGVVLASALAWELPVLTTPGRGLAAALPELGLTLPIYAVVGAVLFGGRLLLTFLRESAERLSDEHRALRRLATAVAEGRNPVQVCNAAAEQAARLLKADGVGIARFAEEDVIEFIGTWPPDRDINGVGVRVEVPPEAEVALVRRLGRPLRIDDYGERTDKQARMVASLGFHTWVGSPILVRGRVWGVIAVMGQRPHSFAPGTEQHLHEFGELVGMAVANTEHFARLSADATTDPLTGLANHRAFQDRLREELSRARRHDRPLAVALVDVDDFKAINDAGGHGAGDEVLQALAGELREHLREGDVLARVGGDELAVLLPDSGAEEAAAALERARQSIECATFPGGARPTISAGVCDLAHAQEPEALMRFADGALYWSKEHGRNRVSVYDPATIQELSAAERLVELQRSRALVGIRALARAIDARDPSTSEHSERVAALTARLAEQCGWPSDRVAQLHEAALVHDVGKIGTPDAILLKPSRLTPEEFEVVKQHAALGARIVEDVLDPEQVEWILSHHERPDGGGYPRGLRGDALSEGGALLAAADAFDVMISTRPYSPGRSVEDALDECRRLVGRQFTAQAVAALEAIHAPAAAAPAQLAA